MLLALDATYSVGDNLSGVGVYSSEMLRGLADAHPEASFQFCYRPHRFLRSLRAPLPANARRTLLLEPFGPRSAGLFHGLNQRLPRARLRRAVSTFHDLFVITGDYSTADFRRRFEAQARDAAQRSDLVIAVSAFTAWCVQNYLEVESSRVRVVHHGVHAPAQPPPSPDQREPIILHVGALQKRKNVARLIEAFERIPEPWRLVLIGAEGFGAAEILARMESSPARARIERIGYASRGELEAWYARAAILAFASLDEGFGLPLVEAMAWGLAIVTSDCSALPEVAGDAALLVDPQDTEALTNALILLTSNPDLRRDLATRGRARAAGFTWRASVSKTWSVYSELLARS